MKVSELIEKLKNRNPDAKVLISLDMSYASDFGLWENEDGEVMITDDYDPGSDAGSPRCI